MKKTIFTLILFVNLIFTLKSQTSFACTYRTLTVWNDYTKKYEDVDSYTESSLFEVNSKETMFIHTISSVTSTYYVKSREYDETNKVWTYDVISDVGNSYYFVFDPKNYEVRAAYKYNNNIYMIVFAVKSIF